MYDRLKEYIDYLDITINKFEQNINVGRGSILRAISGKSGVNADTILKIYDKYHTLNFDWLITGRGEMLYENDKNLQANDKNQSYDSIDVVKILMELNDVRKRVEDMMDETTRLKVENILLKKGDAQEEMLATGTDQQVTQ